MDYPVQELEFLDLTDADEDECHFLHATLFTRNPNLKYPELPWVELSDVQCTPAEWRPPPYTSMEPVEGPTTVDENECDPAAPQNSSPVIHQIAGEIPHEPQTVSGSDAHTTSSVYPDASVMSVQAQVPTSVPAPAQPSVITTMYHQILPSGLPPLSNVYVGNVTANVNVHGYVSAPMNPYAHIPQQVYSGEIPHESPAPVTVRNGGRDSRRGRGGKMGNKRVDGQYTERNNAAARHAQEVISSQPAPMVESPPTGNANLPPQAYPAFIPVSPMHHHAYQAQYYNPSTATHPAPHHLSAQHATGTPIYLPSHPPHMYPPPMYGGYSPHQPPGTAPIMPFPGLQSAAPVPTTENSVLGSYQVEGSGTEEQVPIPQPTVTVTKEVELADANVLRHRQKQPSSPVQQVVCTSSYQPEHLTEVLEPNCETVSSVHNTKPVSYQQQQSEEEDYSNTNLVGTVVVNNSNIVTEPLAFSDNKQNSSSVDSVNRNLPQSTGHQNLVKDVLPSKFLSEKVKKEVLVNNVPMSQTSKVNVSETNTNVNTVTNDLDVKKDKALVSVNLPPAKSPSTRDVPVSAVITSKSALGPPVDTVAPFAGNHPHSVVAPITVQHDSNGQTLVTIPAASHSVPSEVPIAALSSSPPITTAQKPSWASLFKSPSMAPDTGNPYGAQTNSKPLACVKPFQTPGSSQRVSEASSTQSVSSVSSGVGILSGDNVKSYSQMPPPSVDDPHLYQMGELLSKYQLEHKALSLQPRGLTNRSNWCYINSTLQALLACPPFYNLMKALPLPRPGKSATPIIDSMVQFVNEFIPLSAANRVRDRKEKAIRKDDGTLEVQCGAAFEPSYIYKMLNNIRSDTFKVEGRQEDAEEFLGCLLNALNDEMLELIKLVEEPATKSPLSNGDIATNGDTSAQSQDEDDSEWTVMGPKNKGSITRRADLGTTPISAIFRGQLRSRVQRAGDQSTDNVQPFFTLQLDIEKATSVKDALESLTGKDVLEGVTCSRTNQEVEAWQQVTLEELPLVLLLHLKWFDYKLDGASKIVKCVEFPIDLKVDQKLLSSNKKYGPKQRQYKLFAVVYHDGKEATKGHYITDVFHVGYGGWVRYDDSAVKAVQESNVLRPRGPRVPYLLYYRRCDTIGNPPPTPAPDKTR